MSNGKLKYPLHGSMYYIKVVIDRLSVGVTDRGYCCAYCSGNKNDNPGACCNKIKFILDMIRI